IDDRCIGDHRCVEQPMAVDREAAVGRRFSIRPGAWVGLCQCANRPRATQNSTGGLAGQLQPRGRGRGIGDRRRVLSRRSWLYPQLAVGVGSLSIVAVASIWLIERSLNVNII